MSDRVNTNVLDDELRDRLYESIYEEFVGPIDFFADQLVDEEPTLKYNAGVLHPRGSTFELEGSGEADNQDEAPEVTETPPPAGVFLDVTGRYSDDDSRKDHADEEPISLSNARQQSALSMTIAIRDRDDISVEINAATYSQKKVEGKKRYVREPHRYSISDQAIIPRSSKDDFKRRVDDGGLELRVVHRRRIEGADVVTVALCNVSKGDDTFRNCYFQASFKVVSRLGLVPPAWADGPLGADSAEEANRRLIYRNVRNYAVGHGCATDWERGDSVTWAETRVMPIAETRAMKPSHPLMNDVHLPIEAFGNPERWGDSLRSMRDMCAKYREWILSIEASASTLPKEYHKAAMRNISECQECLRRMSDGVLILESDAIARRAFLLANEAMYSQFLHYSVVTGDRKSIDEPVPYVREWRPFQLAFILMNLKPMVDETSDEREVVDLIWFPTGGGKTEAYLGLTAFILIYERLRGTTSDGVTVFTRYTLRLLTSQQFDRASSLICALEVMRRREPDILGSRPFSIGLWVGNEVSPNKTADAVELRNKYVNSTDAQSPFPVTRCPWCGTKFDTDKERAFRVEGLDGELIVSCSNAMCEFGDKRGLPLEIVDEQIYRRPPSILVGTLDKFAMLPYRREALALFGIKDGQRLRPPKLIIQDELHLISGPLGSMAGHYETLVSSLCERQTGGRRLIPKIVASTATVSRAKEQCNQLYACGQDRVFQFPPSGIDYDDSFFSVEDKQGRGRRYVGVFVPTLKEASTNIRVYSDLMWEPATWTDVPDEWKDRYWTTVGYYGTTRELGQAVTWMGGDIPERLWEHRRRSLREGKDVARYVNVAIELTGRKSSDEVKSGLDSLSISYPDKEAVDLCFATNMISVGLDISRLGLMVVAGQPKSTAEYIQATSRVGRGDAKGIVFVVYSTTKPRDRSHYENFAMYHQSFYQNVEPTSVTPFCTQVRDRALFGTLAGIYESVAYHDNPESYRYPLEDAFSFAEEAILRRVRTVDVGEADETKADLDEIKEWWSQHTYQRWEELNPEKLGPNTPLMHPLGADTHEDWGDSVFEVPTSLRSVDAECRVTIIGSYDDVRRTRRGHRA